MDSCRVDRGAGLGGLVTRGAILLRLRRRFKAEFPRFKHHHCMEILDNPKLKYVQMDVVIKRIAPEFEEYELDGVDAEAVMLDEFLQHYSDFDDKKITMDQTLGFFADAIAKKMETLG